MPFTESELDCACEVAIHAAHTGALIFNFSAEQLSVQSRGILGKTDKALEQRCCEEIAQRLRFSTPSYTLICPFIDGNEDIVLSETPTWVLFSAKESYGLGRGVPDSCVSIALVVDEEVVVGVVYSPGLAEVYSAVKGRGAFLNGQRICIDSFSVPVNESIFIWSKLLGSEKKKKSLASMQRELQVLGIHSVESHPFVALNMCFVAAGKADIYFQPEVKLWDYSAGVIILSEAGGLVRGLEGKKDSGKTQTEIWCCNHEDLFLSVSSVLSRYTK